VRSFRGDIPKLLPKLFSVSKILANPPLSVDRSSLKNSLCQLLKSHWALPVVPGFLLSLSPLTPNNDGVKYNMYPQHGHCRERSQEVTTGVLKEPFIWSLCFE
jgi:hypothetical protein